MFALCRFIVVLTLTFFVESTPLFAQQLTLKPVSHTINTTPLELFRQGQVHYQNNDFNQSIKLWQQALVGYQQQHDVLNQGVVFISLTQAYQQLSRWDEANAAMAQSLRLLEQSPESRDLNQVTAQARHTQGSLLLAQSQLKPALTALEQADSLYAEVGNTHGQLLSQIHQAQVLRGMGFARRSLSVLTQVNQTLSTQPDSPLKASGLRQLGHTLRLVGDIQQAQVVLHQSLQIASDLELTADLSAALLGLGAIAEAQQHPEEALDYYVRAATTPHLPTQLQALVNQFTLAIKSKQWPLAQRLHPQIQQKLVQVPKQRTYILTQLSFAKALITAEQQRQSHGTNRPPQFTPFLEIAQFLTIPLQQSRSLGDTQSEAYALGLLGSVYESNHRFQEARELTSMALRLAQSLEAPDLIYKWQWQLGRIAVAERRTEDAIAAYTATLLNLDIVRRDLRIVKPALQLAFREDVEKVYRQFVTLLLTNSNRRPTQQHLKQATQVIDALQITQLENFLSCDLSALIKLREQNIDTSAAYIHAIVLDKGLDVIVKLPNGEEFHHHQVAIAPTQFAKKLKRLRRELAQPYQSSQGLRDSQDLYDWLLRPVKSVLAEQQVKTLVFVLDGELQGIPMATLHDGQQYLIEQGYAVALVPSLELLEPQPLTQHNLKALAFGLSETRDNFGPHQGFGPLQYVEQEVTQLGRQLSSRPQLNQKFTTQAFSDLINIFPTPIVHLATHGQFSSVPEKTFILTWDGKMSINTLADLLRQRTQGQSQPIELLILSACETAEGDRWASLGLAGIAVQSGARSTVASLWSIEDRSTAKLMTRFYQELATGNVSRAEALRLAQLELLETHGYRSPRYWAPFLLVGNWL